MGFTEFTRHSLVFTLYLSGQHSQRRIARITTIRRRVMAHGHIHGALKVFGDLLVGGLSLGAVGALVVGVQGHGGRALFGGVEVVPGIVTFTSFGGGYFGGVTRG